MPTLKLNWKKCSFDEHMAILLSLSLTVHDCHISVMSDVLCIIITSCSSCFKGQQGHFYIYIYIWRTLRTVGNEAYIHDCKITVSPTKKDFTYSITMPSSDCCFLPPLIEQSARHVTPPRLNQAGPADVQRECLMKYVPYQCRWWWPPHRSCYLCWSGGGNREAGS